MAAYIEIIIENQLATESHLIDPDAIAAVKMIRNSEGLQKTFMLRKDGDEIVFYGDRAISAYEQYKQWLSERSSNI